MISLPFEKRLGYVRDFYALLDELCVVAGGTRTLNAESARSKLPQRGVYFFFERSELRTHSGHSLRVVRVGTHALKAGAQSTLWSRLRQHKGSMASGGGNHRCSIFRLIVGDALLARRGESHPTWGDGSNAPTDVKARELDLEREVSTVIRDMPFICLPVNDEAGPQSMRRAIERNAIALLSNVDRDAVDPPSNAWLGSWCRHGQAHKAGIWNSDHVDAAFEPGSLDIMSMLVAKMRREQ